MFSLGFPPISLVLQTPACCQLSIIRNPRRIQERSADFPVRSNVKDTGVAEFFGTVERSKIAADWKVRAPFLFGCFPARVG